jgi:hypothetical protein
LYKRQILTVASIGSIAAVAHAAPIEIDTPEALIVVVRPSDIWSGDTASMEKNLDAIKDKKFSFTYKVDGITHNGNPMLFGSLSNHPVVQGVVTEIAKDGWALGHSENRNSLWVEQAISIKPADMNDFIAAQNEHFRRMVIAQGDPETLSLRTSGKKILGSVLAVGALVVSANKLGDAYGSQLAIGTGITDDIYRVSFEYKAVVTPTFIENLDLTKYESIDVRRVKTRFQDRLGQVIIAYKQPKSTVLENKLMISAILSLAGVNADTDEIEKNRKADFAQRKAIWNICVSQARPECKAE